MKETKSLAKKVASRHLLAKIQLTPRNTLQYLQILSRKLKDSIRALVDIGDFLKKHPDAENFQSFFRDISNGSFDEDSFWWVKRVEEKGFWSLDNFLNNKSMRDRKGVEYIYGEIEGLDFQSGLRELKSISPKKALEEYKWHKENVPKEVLLKIIKVPTFVHSIEVWVQDAKEKLKELIKALKSGIGVPPYLPETEKLEQLYHTSINAKTLARTGFHLGVQKTEGLGGSITTKSGKPAVSFTADFHVAKEIMRCLKEAILIAHRKLKRHHLIDWARRSNILPDVLRAAESISSGEPSEDPVDVMALYQAYLAFSNRYNPVFFGNMEDLMRVLARKSPGDVAIMVCLVDMTNPDIEYLHSMREYRVPAISVKKILKVVG